MPDGLTVMVTLAVVLPPLFVAVTVYSCDGEDTEGVPLITPVEGLIARLAGNVGVME
jgi:hypothetical protein